MERPTGNFERCDIGEATGSLFIPASTKSDEHSIAGGKLRFDEAECNKTIVPQTAAIVGPSK
jgi:hypothetical protein